MHACKDVRGVSGEKGASVRGEVVQLGVGSGGADGVGGEFDAGDGVEVGGEEDGEEAAAAVGVDEVRWRYVVCLYLYVCVRACVCRSRSRDGKDGVPHIIGEWNENGIVVLEKGVSGKLKVGVADAFAYGRFVVCDADVLGWVVWGGVSEVDRGGLIEGIAEQEGDAFFVGPYVSVSESASMNGEVMVRLTG